METEPVTVDICICTYQRAHVALTLASIARMDPVTQCSWRVIVADNDIEPSAQLLVHSVSDLPVTYLHVPAHNAVLARNACLDRASADIVAFLDDDIIASKTWLADMLATLREAKATAVFGPVLSNYPPNTPAWLRLGDFHAKQAVWVKKKPVSGPIANMLLDRRSPAIAALRFHENLGPRGGVEQAFFRELTQAGATLAYAPNAPVYETIPPHRATLSWLIQRRWYDGITRAQNLREAGRNPQLQAARALIAATLNFLLVPLTLLHKTNKYRFGLRGIEALATACGLLKHQVRNQ